MDSLPAHLDQGYSTPALLLRALYIGTAYLTTYRREKEPDEVIAIVYLAPYTDPVLGLKTLLIYSFASIGPVGIAEYPSIFNDVKNFAREMGFASLSAFTRETTIARMAERLGGDVSTTFIQFEV